MPAMVPLDLLPAQAAHALLALRRLAAVTERGEYCIKPVFHTPIILLF